MTISTVLVLSFLPLLAALPLEGLAEIEEGEIVEYTLDSLPDAWRPAAMHAIMDVRADPNDVARLYVRRGDWNLDGREDFGVVRRAGDQPPRRREARPNQFRRQAQRRL
jgi:hypothetical protein